MVQADRLSHEGLGVAELREGATTGLSRRPAPLRLQKPSCLDWTDRCEARQLLIAPNIGPACVTRFLERCGRDPLFQLDDNVAGSHAIGLVFENSKDALHQFPEATTRDLSHRQAMVLQMGPWLWAAGLLRLRRGIRALPRDSRLDYKAHRSR